MIISDMGEQENRYTYQETRVDQAKAEAYIAYVNRLISSAALLPEVGSSYPFTFIYFEDHQLSGCRIHHRRIENGVGLLLTGRTEAEGYRHPLYRRVGSNKPLYYLNQFPLVLEYLFTPEMRTDLWDHKIIYIPSFGEFTIGDTPLIWERGEFNSAWDYVEFIKDLLVCHDCFPDPRNPIPIRQMFFKGHLYDSAFLVYSSKQEREHLFITGEDMFSQVIFEVRRKEVIDTLPLPAVLRIGDVFPIVIPPFIQKVD